MGLFSSNQAAVRRLVGSARAGVSLPVRYAGRMLVPAAAVLLGACGFHLEGAGNLPAAMAKTYVQAPDRSSDFLYSLRDVLRERGLTIVDTPAEAGAVLVISQDNTGQRVLSVSAQNIPREYEVFYTVTFAVHSGGKSLLKPQSLVATRSYTYNETQVLGKGREEEVLRKALAKNLAQQVVRRIEAIKAKPATPAG